MPIPVPAWDESVGFLTGHEKVSENFVSENYDFYGALSILL